MDYIVYAILVTLMVMTILFGQSFDTLGSYLQDLLQSKILRLLKPLPPWWYHSKEVVCWYQAKIKSWCCTHPSTKTKWRNHVDKMTISHIPSNSSSPWNITKWGKNEEVICRLKEVKLLPPIKPKVPSKIIELTTTFSSTLDTLPTQKQIQELRSKITSKNYLTTTFKWSHITNQHLKSMIQQIQQYEEMMTEFKE